MQGLNASKHLSLPCTGDGLKTFAFRGRELTGHAVTLPSGAAGRVLAPGQARIMASATAVAAPKPGAWKKLRGRGRGEWSDDSDSDAEEAADAPPQSMEDRLSAALRPDMTWTSQHKFHTFTHW